MNWNAVANHLLECSKQANKSASDHNQWQFAVLALFYKDIGQAILCGLENNDKQ